MAKKRSSDTAKEANYDDALRDLQIELVKLQNDVIANNRKVLILFEGRDAGGKDGAIKRFTEHLSPRETRIIALGKPTEREASAWYFQRFVPHLPYADEIVFFNRSWYNRAGVERVMGFSTPKDYDAFIRQVVPFELALLESGVEFIKYYLDISKEEQKERLKARAIDPLKQWKLSPIDHVATEKWDDYSAARNDMFQLTSTERSPWHIVKANKKKKARLNVIRHVLSKLDYKNKKAKLANPDPEFVFPYEPACLTDGRLET